MDIDAIGRGSPESSKRKRTHNEAEEVAPVPQEHTDDILRINVYTIGGQTRRVHLPPRPPRNREAGPSTSPRKVSIVDIYDHYKPKKDTVVPNRSKGKGKARATSPLFFDEEEGEEEGENKPKKDTVVPNRSKGKGKARATSPLFDDGEEEVEHEPGTPTTSPAQSRTSQKRQKIEGDAPWYKTWQSTTADVGTTPKAAASKSKAAKRLRKERGGPASRAPRSPRDTAASVASTGSGIWVPPSVAAASIDSDDDAMEEDVDDFDDEPETETTRPDTARRSGDDGPKPNLPDASPSGPLEPLILLDENGDPTGQHVPAVINQYLQGYQKKGVLFMAKRIAAQKVRGWTGRWEWGCGAGRSVS
jgi:hypothetical protein